MKLEYLSFSIFLLIILNTSAVIPVQAQNEKLKTPDWCEIEDAVKLNSVEPRKFLIYIYSDNCGWCRKMENETFSSDPVIDYINQNFYAVKINSNIKRDIQYDNRKFSYVAADPKTGNPAHHEFLLILLQGRMAFPSIAYLDENMVFIEVQRGFKSIDPFRKYLAFINENKYLEGLSFDQYINKK